MYAKTTLWNERYLKMEKNDLKEAKDMGKKLKDYIQSLRSFLENTAELSDPEGFKRELVREIQFWQHERFIHLIVTFMFAIITVAVLLVMIFKPMIPLFLLFVLLLCLLVPYITHYFVLENGVQTLYVIYEEVCRRYMDKSVPAACLPEGYGIKIEKLK